jgi:lipopolysaccharide/colanic/teichoic acid biosynthesis glycosyltransferase
MHQKKNLHKSVFEILYKSYNKGVIDFIEQYVDLNNDSNLIISSTNKLNIKLNNQKITSLINLSKVNNIRFINKFFECVNERLDVGDTFICCSETIQARRNRQQIRKIPIVRNFYYVLEFILLRIFPKVWGIKKIYFFITQGKRRLLSKAEVLGRLVSCGFEIVEVKTIDDILFISSRKIKAPDFNVNASYGPLYKMPRVGKGGKIIGVYKMRTMHPFAEYLQEYIINNHGYAKSGKPENDFRLTPWGKIFRKYWLDELPQLINMVKGDLKLVGVRPVGKFYFDSLPEEIKQKRIKHKPGCIPPYVALNRKPSLEEVLKAEMEYMIEKEKNPYFTDIKYFFNAIFNIIVRGKRSA